MDLTIVKAICDHCRIPIKTNKFFRLKNDFDNHFCSRDCIEKYVLENAEIREDVFDAGDDE